MNLVLGGRVLLIKRSESARHPKIGQATLSFDVSQVAASCHIIQENP